MDGYSRVDNTIDWLEWYLIPEHKIAVPVGHDSLETLAAWLAEHGDYTTSQELDSYPKVDSKQVEHFGYSKIPMRKVVTVYKPRECYSGWEVSIRERQRKVAQENQTRANRIEKIKGNPFHRDSDLADI